jgi:ubiquinone/menaquinone biosynthesis C-methylase UbiE
MEVEGMVKSSTPAMAGGAGGAGDSLRRRLHGMWSEVAKAWGDNADYIDVRGASVTERLLERAALRPGDRVLELACGPGGLGLAAARRVGLAGEVVLSDVVPEMTEIAAARAKARGLANVTTRVLDAERIDQPDAAFNAVLCREGLMLVPDPQAAVREIVRVLRPGGRLAVAVWGPRARNPWLGALFDVLSAGFGTPLPPPGVPHPFSLDDVGRLEAMFGVTGLADIAVEPLETPYLAASSSEWWQRTCALAGPVAREIAAQPKNVQRALAERAKDAISVFQTPEGLKIPGLTLIVSARRR